MHLIGAKSSFIRGPFLLRALLLGVLSGLIAFGILFVAIYALDQYLNEFDIHLHVYHSIELNIALIVGMLLIGGMIGFFSTFMAVSKYLKMRLEDLY
jgi:cell division transport system permease protein